MRIAAIPIATAELGSDGGVIDGCARVHWRGRAMFPAAGDGGGKTISHVGKLKTAVVQLGRRGRARRPEKPGALVY